MALGNLSNPSVNRWGSTLIWFNILKTVSKQKITIQQALLLQHIIFLFLKGGLTETRHLLSCKLFDRLPFSTEVKAKDEPWYQRRYFKRVKFKSSFLDEDLFYFEPRFNSRLYVGQIKILHFNQWTLLLVAALRTFSRHNLKWNKKRRKPRKPKVNTNSWFTELGSFGISNRNFGNMQPLLTHFLPSSNDYKF